MLNFPHTLSVRLSIEYKIISNTHIVLFQFKERNRLKRPYIRENKVGKTDNANNYQLDAEELNPNLHKTIRMTAKM